MSNLELKKQLLTKCLEIQKDAAITAKSASEEMQESANDYGQPTDRYDSYRTQLLKKKDMHSEQYAKAKEDIALLEKIDVTKEHKSVEYGSLVITNKQKMFISISIGKVNINNDNYYAISTKVPIYEFMKGKKEGDEFIFNGNKFIIQEIY